MSRLLSKVNPTLQVYITSALPYIKVPCHKAGFKRNMVHVFTLTSTYRTSGKALTDSLCVNDSHAHKWWGLRVGENCVRLITQVVRLYKQGEKSALQTDCPLVESLTVNTCEQIVRMVCGLYLLEGEDFSSAFPIKEDFHSCMKPCWRA